MQRDGNLHGEQQVAKSHVIGKEKMSCIERERESCIDMYNSVASMNRLPLLPMQIKLR